MINRCRCRLKLLTNVGIVCRYSMSLRYLEKMGIYLNIELLEELSWKFLPTVPSKLLLFKLPSDSRALLSSSLQHFFASSLHSTLGGLL